MGMTDAPQLPYRPPVPKRLDAGIGLVGCGAISQWHLRAYRKAGFRVVALCSRDRGKAESRRAEFYPAAAVCDDYRDLLRRDDVAVVDATPHPRERLPIVRAALDAGRHVLSQKPFVLDLDEGERLAERADRRGVRLAVNQNGRWAPHFAYLRAAVAGGAIGDLASANFTVNWDHSWTADTAFNEIYDLVLY